MARFTKRTVLLLLGILVLLSLAVRYPLVEHERHQTDSYFMHSLAQSIVSDGYASWAFHPLSYFGYYPFSYPSGVPFLLADLSSTTGLSIELCILVMNMAFAVIFCLAVFGLSRQFLMRDEYALLATFFAVMASRFVDTTYWVASARGPLVVMTVLIVFVSFRSSESRRNAYWFLAMLFIFASLVIHHMAVLLALLGLGFVFAVIEAQYLIPRIQFRKRTAALGLNLMILLMITVVAFGYLSYFRNPVSAYVDSNFLRTDWPAVTLLLSVAASYTNQVGFILAFAVLGAPVVLWKHRIDTKTLFMVTLLILFVPMVNSSIYVSMVIAPFVAMLGTRWISQMLKSSRRVLASLIVVVLIAVSAVLPIWSCDRWNSEQYVGGDTVEVENQLFSDAAYIRVSNEGTSVMSNSNDLTLRMRALTDANFLGSGVFLVLNGDIVSRDVHSNVTWSSRDFPVNLYIWFEYANEPSVDSYVLGTMMYGFRHIAGPHATTGPVNYFSNHQKVVIIVDNNWPSNSVSSYSVLPGPLMTQLRDAGWKLDASSPTSKFMPVESYCTYQSSGVTLYMVNLPLA
jgi:hypothetical protein